MSDAVARNQVRATELVRRRLALGLTQTQLADAIGVSRRTIARWEALEETIPRPYQVDLALRELEKEAPKPA